LIPEPNQPRRSKLAQNTVARSVPLFAGYIASFVSAPIVLNGLGLRAFGIWALSGALAQYAALLDFGVGPSLSRFIALYDADDRPDKVGEVMVAGLATSLLIGLVLIAASVLGAGEVADQIHGISDGEMRALLLSATCIFLCSTLMNALTAYLVGLRQMVGPGVLATIGAGINFSFSVGAVLASHSVVVYGLANAAASLLTLLLVAGYTLGRRHRRPPFRRPARNTIRHLVGFSLRNQMQTAATLVNDQTDKIIIAIFIGPAAAGAYELANRVAAAARAVGVYSVSALVPTLTAELRNADRRTWMDTYETLTRTTTALAVPLLLMTASLAPLILGAWLGHVPRNSSLVIVALCLGYVVNTTTGVGYSVAYARGFPGIPAQSAVVMAVANLILTAALAPILGIWGVLSGTALAFSAGAFLQVLLLHRRLDMPLSRYWRATLPTIILSALLALPMVACSIAFFDSSRALKAVVLCLCGAYYVVSYTALAHRQGTLPRTISRLLPVGV
jgi:O-antigen/teichoic acid export membrane protein